MKKTELTKHTLERIRKPCQGPLDVSEMFPGIWLLLIKHWWFSGKILTCHSGGLGSVPVQWIKNSPNMGSIYLKSNLFRSFLEHFNSVYCEMRTFLVPQVTQVNYGTVLLQNHNNVQSPPATK